MQLLLHCAELSAGYQRLGLALDREDIVLVHFYRWQQIGTLRYFYQLIRA